MNMTQSKMKSHHGEGNCVYNPTLKQVAIKIFEQHKLILVSFFKKPKVGRVRKWAGPGKS